MVPGNWLSVLFFVLLVAPGLLFELLSERRRAGIPESAFREISRVVLASLGFSGLALGILAIVRTVRPKWMPPPGKLLGASGTYLSQHYGLVLWALLAEGLLALGAVGLVHLLLAHKQGAAIRPVSTWRQVFRNDCPADCEVFARVRLTDGIIYAGAVAAFTTDPGDDGGDLVLAPPIFSRLGNGELKPVPPTYQRVVIPRSAVEVLSVEYRRPPSTRPASGAPPEARAGADAQAP